MFTAEVTLVCAEKEYHMRKNRAYQRQCQYCGRLKPETDDHVVPKCLYNNKSNSTVKIKACQNCNNNQKSPKDSLVKLFTVSTPLSQAGDAMKRSVTDDLKRRNIDIHNPQLENVFSRSGLWVGEHVSFDMPKDLIDGCFWMIRGLVARSKEHVFVGATQCRQITKNQYMLLASLMERNSLAKSTSTPYMDDDIEVLEVESCVSYECPRTGVFRLRFYGDQDVFVATIPDNSYGLLYS